MWQTCDQPEIKWLIEDMWLGVSWPPVKCPFRDIVAGELVKPGAGTAFIDKETHQSVAVPGFCACTSHAHCSQCSLPDSFSCPYTIACVSTVIWDSQVCLQHSHRAVRNRSNSGRSCPTGVVPGGHFATEVFLLENDLSPYFAQSMEPGLKLMCSRWSALCDLHCLYGPDVQRLQWVHTSSTRGHTYIYMS